MHILIYQENLGNSDDNQFRWCAESIHRHSPSCSLIRFGGQGCIESLSGFRRIKDYDTRANELEKTFTNNSPNGHEFEWRSIKRWMVFAEFCRQEKVTHFFHCDSDVLIFTDIKQEAKRLHQSEKALSLLQPSERNELLTLGCSFFHRIEPLFAFEEWLFKVFAHRQTDLYNNIMSQNVSDMWLWTCFLRQHPEYDWQDLCRPKLQSAYDPNLCVVDGWANDGVSKIIHFEHGKPFGYFQNLKIQLHCLHCWGPWKNQMEKLWVQSKKP